MTTRWNLTSDNGKPIVVSIVDPVSRETVTKTLGENSPRLDAGRKTLLALDTALTAMKTTFAWLRLSKGHKTLAVVPFASPSFSWADSDSAGRNALRLAVALSRNAALTLTMHAYGRAARTITVGCLDTPEETSGPGGDLNDAFTEDRVKTMTRPRGATRDEF